MERTERQLLLTALGEPIVLPPEVGTKAAQATGALLLQILRAELEEARSVEMKREGESNDPRL